MSTRWLLFLVMSSIPKMGHLPTPENMTQTFCVIGIGFPVNDCSVFGYLVGVSSRGQAARIVEQ